MLKAARTLGMVFFPAYDWAIGPSHPEREERLLYTQDQVMEEGVFDIEGIHLYNPSVASRDDVTRVHFCVPDVETRVPDSHLISAGGAITAGEKLLNGEVEKAFAIVRPPGHHAQRVVYGDRGFCIINIEAVMIEHLRHIFGRKKIAVVDTDCHHGDGTQDIYWNDADTLYISFHQDGRTLYPGSGFIDELGGPSAYGYTINIPLPPQTGEEGFLYVLDNLVLPILDEYEPDLVINSAGQDNHYTDPITNMKFTAQGYAELNRRLSPDIAVLEGGYSIEGALPYVNLGIILAMAGMDYSHVREPDYDEFLLRQDPEITDYIKKLCPALRDRWNSRKTRAEGIRGKKEVITESRRVYYDTDMIMEQQTRSYYPCERCAGIDAIESRSDRGDHVYAVTIPRGACPSCREKGASLFESSKKQRLTNRYLQDRDQDEFFAG